MLGEAPLAVAAGELWYFWERGLLEDRLCACGAAFSECPFWVQVLDVAPELRAAEGDMRQFLQREGRSRHMRRWTSARQRRRRTSPDDQAALERLAVMYRTISEASECPVIVDSSKSPTYGGMLALVPGIDLYVINLVRRPEAVTHSWQRTVLQRDTPGKTYRDQMGTLKSAGLWTLWEAGARGLVRSVGRRGLTVRYEDFVANPGPTLSSIGRLVPELASSPALQPGSSEVVLSPSHFLSGNPNRFTTGAVALRADDEWRQHARPGSRTLVRLITAPLARRVGYTSAP